MSLTGQLSDLSLAELIEFFCNQRKTGRLKVVYSAAPGYFYFKSGELVDAKIGSLSGVDAIYYALTMGSNAAFKFSAAIDPARRTIHQPWASVALEGLRRMDEGVAPPEPVFDLATKDIDPDVTDENREQVRSDEAKEIPFSLTIDRVNESSNNRSKVVVAGVAAAVVLSVAAIGVPAGWYKSKSAAPAAAPVAATQPDSQPSASPSPDAANSQPANASDIAGGGSSASANDAAAALRREREARDRERQRAEERANAADKAQAAPKPEAPKSAQKSVSVQVTYDDSGRVVSISGGDGSVQRIARQRRFPAGKAGTATISIPVN
jgi:hypothetical protein